MEPLANRVPKVLKVHQAHREPMVHPVLLVNLGNRANKEKRVSARNIALWMVVFSSKMAQEDDKSFYSHSVTNVIYILLIIPQWFGLSLSTPFPPISSLSCGYYYTFFQSHVLFQVLDRQKPQILRFAFRFATFYGRLLLFL